MKHDARLKKKALAAYAASNNVQGTARDLQIDRRTLQRWIKEDASGGAVAAGTLPARTANAAGAPAPASLVAATRERLDDALHGDMIATLKLGLRKLRSAIAKGKLKPQNLAFAIGVLADKQRLFAPPAPPGGEGEELQVAVFIKRGGARVKPGESATRMLLDAPVGGA